MMAANFIAQEDTRRTAADAIQQMERGREGDGSPYLGIEYVKQEGQSFLGTLGCR